MKADWCVPDDCPASICNGPHVAHHCPNGDLVVSHIDNETPCPFCGHRRDGTRPTAEAEPSREFLERVATDVLVAGWRMVQRGQVDARSPLGDALLNLRDALNPDWPDNANWLPTALSSPE